MIKRRCLFVLLLSLLVLYKPRICFSEDSSDLSGKYKGCNVVLIILDALRPDHLGCYGYTLNTSPAIDTLTHEGVVFTNAFSQAPLTLPSVVSIFTSLYPFSHQVNYIFKDRLPQRVYTLAQIMHIYGYATVWFGSLWDPHSGRAPGVLKGFDEKHDIHQCDTGSVVSWIRLHKRENFFVTIHSYQSHEMRFPFQSYNNSFSREVSKTMKERLDRAWAAAWKDMQERLRKNPGSLYHFFGKEWIEANRRYLMLPYSRENLMTIYRLMEDQEQKNQLDLLLWSKEASVLFETFYLENFNKEELLDLLLLFDSAIFEIDNGLIRQLVNELKKINIYDKTIIIVTADHGNEFKEHGHIGHGCYLYDESIHVPLIFHLPRFRESRRMEELVESVDILPTVLDLLGIPIPSQSQGISLTRSMKGSKSELTKKYILNQSITGLTGIRSKEWKLILDCKKSNQGSVVVGELFDMRGDPREQNNLITERPDVAKALPGYFKSKLSGMVIYEDAQGEFMPFVDEKMKERIKKIGY